jgi:DNA-binding MarR family transcriptional regulator
MNKRQLAKQLLEVVPPTMARIRNEWRSFAPPEISIPQLRILGSVFKGRNLIGDIAKHQGVSQPAMSMLVEALIKKGYLKKTKSVTDKRQSPLALTAKGLKTHQKTRQSTEVKLSKALDSLSEADCLELEKGLLQIKKIFSEIF